VGRIIGKGGETINYLQSTSGTRIQIDQNVPEGTPCKVSVAGAPPAVAAAVKMVHECMENGPPREIAMQQNANPYGARPQAGVMGAYGARPAAAGYGQQQPYGAAAGGYGAAMGGYGQPQPGYGAPAPAAAGYGGYGAQAGGYGQQAYGAPPARGGYGAPAPTPPAWSEHATDDGTKYWYNAQTGESTWTKPAGM